MQAKQIHTSWNPKRILYSKKMAPYIFVAPFIASFLIFFLYPSIETIRMSFMSMEGFGKERFVGFHNYVRLFNYHFWPCNPHEYHLYWLYAGDYDDHSDRVGRNR